MAEISIRLEGNKDLKACGHLIGFEVVYDADGLGLAQAAQQRGAMPLSQFVSLSGEDQAELMEQFDVSPDELDEPEQWFEAVEGLKTVRAILEHLRISPPKDEPAHYELKWVLRDLQEMEKCFLVVQTEQTRFHISILAD